MHTAVPCLVYFATLQEKMYFHDGSEMPVRIYFLTVSLGCYIV